MKQLSLFWRNVLAFLAAVVVIVVLGMVLTASVARYRFQALDDLNPVALASEATAVAKANGKPGLMRWLREMDSHGSALKIFVVDDDNRDILGRYIEPRKMSHLAERRAEDAARSANGAPLPPPRTDNVVSWWDDQVIQLENGERLLMTFLPFDTSLWEVLSLSPVIGLLGLFALAVSMPVCWVLARQIADPVQSMRRVAGRLASGDLSARTPDTLRHRKDDLGQLARDFDTMATRLEAMVASREQLLRNIAHELRSPLARLRIATELAERRDDTLGTQFTRIEREIGRLDSLVGHTLSLVRAGQTHEAPHPVSLVAVIDGVVKDARFEAAATGASVQWEPPPADPVMVRADAASLASAIENVIRNAMHHAARDDGVAPPQVRVHLSTQGGRAEIQVADNGPGVPPDAVANLFEPFFRVRSRLETAHNGAGLGLSIAQANMRAHGGGVAARNGTPAGLVISLWLPLGAGKTEGLAA